MFFLLYKHTDDGFFDDRSSKDFRSTSFRRFPKIALFTVNFAHLRCEGISGYFVVLKGETENKL